MQTPLVAATISISTSQYIQPQLVGRDVRMTRWSGRSNNPETRVPIEVDLLHGSSNVGMAGMRRRQTMLKSIFDTL
jgi:hypothetical protein